MIEKGSRCIKYKRLHGKSMTCGSKRKKNVLIVLPFYSDRVTGSHGTEHVMDTTTRQMDTQSTRGGVLSMSSRFLYVFILSFSDMFVYFRGSMLHNQVCLCRQSFYSMVSTSCRS